MRMWGKGPPKDNLESWQDIQMFIDEFPDDDYWSKWKPMVREVVCALEARGLASLFRIGQSMHHIHFPQSNATGLLLSHESRWSFIRRSRLFASHTGARISISVSRLPKSALRLPSLCHAFFATSDACGVRRSLMPRFQMHSTPPNHTEVTG